MAEEKLDLASKVLDRSFLEAVDPLKKLRTCIQCGTCSATCPTAYAMDYSPRQVWRMLRIQRVLLKHGLDELVSATHLFRPIAWLRRIPGLGISKAARAQPMGVRIREALVELGPIFVKFGQALSKIVLAKHLAHYLYRSFLPVHRWLKLLEPLNDLGINDIGANSFLLAAVTETCGATTIIAIFASGLCVATHLAKVLDGVGFRWIYATAPAVSEVAEEIRIVSLCRLAVSCPLPTYLLAALEQLFADDRLVSAFEPMDLSLKRTAAIRPAYVFLIFHFPEICAVLQDGAYGFSCEGTP